MGQRLFADHVVGKLAHLVDAPVPSVRLVQVDRDLIEMSSELSHFNPGIGHGSEFIPGCEDFDLLEAQRDLENVSRWASLALLYGWTAAADQQQIRGKQPPKLVYSADHGEFLDECYTYVDDEEWTRLHDRAVLDRRILEHCSIPRSVMLEQFHKLRAVHRPHVEAIVSSAPPCWRISNRGMESTVDLLMARRESILEEEWSFGLGD